MTSKPPKKRVTTLDIAKRAGVSKATVSYVFNGTGSVSPELSKKILAIAEQLGYRPNRLAMATRTGKTHTVGLVLPDLTNPFFPALAQAAQKAARQNGYSVFLVDTQNSKQEERQGIEQLMEYAVEGLMWCPIENQSATTQQYPFPIVIIDRPISGFDSVFADSFKGGQLQGQYVLRNGHHRVGILSGPNRSASAAARRKGLYSVLKGTCDILWDFHLEYNFVIPPEIQSQILQKQPTCIVAANDTLAISLLRLYHQTNIQVPKDVSIIGFDDIDWANLVTPPLTTVKLPINNIGKYAFELLLSRLKDPNTPIENKIIDVELVERDSFRAI